MNRSASLKIALLASLAFAYACGGAGSVDDGTSDEGALSQGAAPSHVEAVSKCQESLDKVAISRAPDASDQKALGACLVAADDAAVEQLENILSTKNASFAGKTSAIFATYRATAKTFCAELALADANANGPDGETDSARCAANRELFLAQAIDTYSALGDGVAASIRLDRDHHAACYQAYDANATHTEQAAADLADCIVRDIDPLVPEVAKAEANNGHGQNDAATQMRIGGYTHAVIINNHEVCITLNQAGQDGNDAMRSVSIGECYAALAENVYLEMSSDLGLADSSGSTF